jgi:ubiquinone/menaquinone biosynthesis C-methylase UbiE
VVRGGVDSNLLRRAKVMGIDISLDMIAIAARRLGINDMQKIAWTESSRSSVSYADLTARLA